MSRPSRSQWRDGVKRSTLAPTTRLVALLMADYWPKEDDADLWCAIDTIMSQSGLSRATTYRAVAALTDGGWLIQTEATRHNRAPRYAPALPENSHSETVQSQDDGEPSHGETRLCTDTTPNPAVGSDDPNSGLPAGPEATHRAAKKKPRKPTAAQQEQMNADFRELVKVCREIGEEDPYAVWWTLRLDHKITSPHRFMADLVDKGQWEGFVGRHGINAYERPA